MTLFKMLLAFEYVKTEAKSSRRYKSGTLDLVQNEKNFKCVLEMMKFNQNFFVEPGHSYLNQNSGRTFWFTRKTKEYR